MEKIIYELLELIRKAEDLEASIVTKQAGTGRVSLTIDCGKFLNKTVDKIKATAEDFDTFEKYELFGKTLTLYFKV